MKEWPVLVHDLKGWFGNNHLVKTEEDWQRDVTGDAILDCRAQLRNSFRFGCREPREISVKQFRASESSILTS